MKPQPARSRFKLPLRTLLVLATLSFILSLYSFDPKLDRGDDNAEYIILARSIAQGRWMQLINQPDSPRSHKFPFGFPLLLAPMEWLAPGNLLAMKALIVALYVLAIPLVYMLLLGASSDDKAPSAEVSSFSSADSTQVLAVTVLTLLNPLLLSYSYQVMSEVPYLLASLLTLLAFERAETSTPAGQGRAVALGALLAVVATTLRVVGLSLGAGAVLWSLLRKQYRRALLVAGLYLGGLLALHLLGAGVVGSFYVQEAMKENPLLPESGHLRWAELPSRIFLNLRVYGLSVLPPTLLPLPRMVPAPLLMATARLIRIPILLLVLLGWGREAAKGRLVALYVLSYVGILALWPSIWPQARYLVPILPFLLWFLVSGVTGTMRGIQRWFSSRCERGPLAATRVVVVVSCLMGLAALLAVYEHRRYYGQYPAYLRGYFEAAEWLGSHAPPDSIILARRPYLLYLLSKRKTLLITAPPTPEHVIELIEKYKPDFFLVDNVNIEGVVGWRKYLVEAIGLRKEWFEPVYFSPTVPSSVIFKVRQGGL